jgi:hypothetical protein
MKSTIERLDFWHKTRKGFMTFGLIELILAYLIISRAIDTGSVWQYGLGIILGIGAAQNIIKAVFYKGNVKE